MPVCGGWMDQAAPFIEAIGIIGSEVAEVEKQLTEKTKAHHG